MGNQGTLALRRMVGAAIAGEHDPNTLHALVAPGKASLNVDQKALEKITQAKNKELVIIPGATHLFEEPGKLEDVASYAEEWFKKYL